MQLRLPVRSVNPALADRFPLLKAQPTVSMGLGGDNKVNPTPASVAVP